MFSESAGLGVGVVIGGALEASAGRAFRTAEQRVSRLGKAVRQTRLRVGRYEEEHRALGRQMRLTGAATREMTARHDFLGGAIDRTRRKLRRYRGDLQRTRNLEGARAGLGRTWAAVGAAAGSARALGGLVGGALEREKAEVHLRTVLVSDDVEADLGRALGHARELVRRRGTLHGETELLDVGYTLSSAGFEAAAARAGMEIVSKVATVTRGAPEEVADVVATSLNTLGDSLEGTDAERLARAGDILTRAQLAFAVKDFGQLGEGMKQVASMASIGRLDMGEAAVFVGALNEVGKQSGAAGTAGDAVLRQLGKAADELGFAVAYDDDGGLDLMTTLGRVGAALERYGDDTAARGEAMQKAFDQEGKVVQLVVEKMLPKMGRQLAEMDADEGYTDRQFVLFRDSGFGGVEALRNNAAVLGNVLGGAPATQEWAARLSDDVVVPLGRAVEGSEALQKSLLGVGLAIVGAGVSSLLISGGMYVWTSLMPVVVGVGRAIGWVARKTGLAAAAQWAYNAAAGGLTAARGALTAVLGLVTFKVAAIGAAVLAVAALIGVAVWLVVKHWEPISGFFSRLWDGIAAGVRAAWSGITAALGAVVEAWGKVFTDFSWARVGDALMKTLAAGIAGAAGLPALAVRTVLGKVRDLLPFSDARVGPLSRLTASGASVLRTVGDGVRRAGPDGLRRPLARELAAASAAVALAPAAFDAAAFAPPPTSARPPAAETRPAPAVVDNSIRVAIHQQPDEDAAALVDRLLGEIERRRGIRRRAALHDDF